MHKIIGAFLFLRKIALFFSLSFNKTMLHHLLLLYYHFCIIISSTALPITNPLRTVIDRINESGPFIGVVMAYATEAEALSSSGEFLPSSQLPPIDLYGRRFHIGSIRDVDVIYVMSGQRRLNAGITVQILLDLFDVWGIVHYGTAGSSNDSMLFGDVSVPKFVAFTGSWTWTKFGVEKKETLELSFGAYNVPVEGKNLLSGVEFKTEELYSVGKPMDEVFWLETDSEWFHVADTLKDIELQQCANASYCLPKKPKVVSGLKASTADIFVDNAAYRSFLFERFGVSTVDQESSAVLMTAMSAGVPAVVFRGVSDLAGEGMWSSTSLSSIASINALKVSVEFITAIGKMKDRSWK